MPLISMTRTRGGLMLISGAAVVSLAVSGCSSSGGSSPSTAPAAGDNSSTGAATSASAGSSAVTAAQAVVAQFEKTPTAIGPTAPLTSPAPAGKTFVYLKCDLPQCAAVGSAVQEAAAAVHWHVQVIDFSSSNIATLISGMKQALRYHPVAVSVPGIPQVLWKSEEAEYQKAGVAIIPQQTGPVNIDATVPVQVGDDGPTAGKIVGNWFVADSNGNGKALLVSVPAFPLLTEIGDNIKSTVKAACSSCSFQDLDATPAQQAANGIVPAIVSALQRNTSLKYIVATDGVLLSGLSSALKAAGLNGIKVGGALATADNEQAIVDGTATAFTSYNVGDVGWQLIDAALRKAEGMTFVANDGGIPEQLFVKSNVGTPSDSASAPADFRDQFKKLWGI